MLRICLLLQPFLANRAFQYHPVRIFGAFIYLIRDLCILLNLRPDLLLYLPFFSKMDSAKIRHLLSAPFHKTLTAGDTKLYSFTSLSRPRFSRTLTVLSFISRIWLISRVLKFSR